MLGCTRVAYIHQYQLVPKFCLFVQFLSIYAKCFCILSADGHVIKTSANIVVQGDLMPPQKTLRLQGWRNHRHQNQSQIQPKQQQQQQQDQHQNSARPPSQSQQQRQHEGVQGKLVRAVGAY